MGTVGGGLIGGGSTTQEFDLRVDANDFAFDSLYRLELPEAVGFEFGVSTRLIDGKVVSRNRDSGQTTERDVTQVFPLIYGGLDWRGLDSLVVRVEGGAISGGGDSASEVRVTAGWRPVSWLTLEGGWWRKAVDFEDDDISIDVDLSGPYFGGSIGF